MFLVFSFFEISVIYTEISAGLHLTHLILLLQVSMQLKYNLYTALLQFIAINVELTY